MNSTDPRSRSLTMRGPYTRGFAMSSAEAAAFQLDQAAQIAAAFREGAEYRAWEEGSRRKFVESGKSYGGLHAPAGEVHYPAGVVREAFRAGRSVTGLPEGQISEALLAPGLVEFQVKQAKKAAKEAQEFFGTILRGIKTGGVNIEGAVNSLWERAKVQAFTVPVIGSVTFADLRSDAFKVETFTEAWDKIEWDKVSQDIISNLAPKGGLADTAMQAINGIQTKLTSVTSALSVVAEASPLVTGLTQISGLIATAMPYVLAVVAIVAVGELIYDWLDDSDEAEEAMKAERAKYGELKAYIGTLLYSGEKSHIASTVEMRCDELAWEAVVCAKVRSILHKTNQWRMPRPMGANGSTIFVTMADRHVATARFSKEARDPSAYYTDPEWKTLATWSTGERWPRKSIRTENLLAGSETRDFKRVTKTIKAANKFLESVIGYLSQETMTVDDKRVAFELLGIQLLSDASHFSHGLWDALRPTAYPTSPLPPATGLVKRDNAAVSTRPLRPLPPTNVLPPQETQALGAKELTTIVASSSSSPYAAQSLSILASCFLPPVSTYLESRGASGSLPPRSYIVRADAAAPPLFKAPQTSLYLSHLSGIELAVSTIFAGGDWNLTGLTVAPHLLRKGGFDTVTETLPLGSEAPDWCYRVVFVRFKTGQVSAAAVKNIAFVNNAPELWQRGSTFRDGRLRSPFNEAKGTIYVHGATDDPAALAALTAASASRQGKAILDQLHGAELLTDASAKPRIAALRALSAPLPSSSPLALTAQGAASYSTALIVGGLAAIGVAWAISRSR